MTHAHDYSGELADAAAVAVAPTPVRTWDPVLVPGQALRAAPAKRRIAGLDGLRAVAVLGVVLFHLDFSLLPGGFLGVDVFFVISGFLITRLIATEVLETGGLRLGRFYLRRARRLLPSVFVLLAVLAVASTTIWRDQLVTLKSGVLASLGYVTNWWLIADHQSYFAATGRPPMVQHLWSLAVEEQYYVVWSLGVVGLVALSTRRLDRVARVRLIALSALVLALVSTAVMAGLAVTDGLPYFGNPSRVYFGSDTHSMGLFLGSAFGAWFAVSRHGAQPGPARLPAKLAWFTDVLGLAVLAVVIRLLFAVTEFSPALYRGGFLGFDALALAVILCALRRRSLLGRVLDMRPIRWVGQRSYAIYLWHWPVVVITRPGLDVHGPLFVINLCRLALVFGLAALTHHFVEVPLRSGQFEKWRAERRDVTRRRWDVTAVLVTLVAAASLAAAATAVGPPSLPTVPSSRPAASQPAASARPSPSRGPAVALPAGAVPAARPPLLVSAFGDSVLLGAETELGTTVRRLDADAVEGRQPYQVLDDVLARAARGALDSYVVIHTGNNGVISPGQLRDTLRALRSRTRVVLVNDRVARDWQDVNNATIAHAASGFGNVVVLDWHAQSSGRRGWLYSDGLHLTKAGAAAYAQLVEQALTRPR